MVEVLVNMIILLKANLSGISHISSHIFVNVNCIIKHEASKFL